MGNWRCGQPVGGGGGLTVAVSWAVDQTIYDAMTVLYRSMSDWSWSGRKEGGGGVCVESMAAAGASRQTGACCDLPWPTPEGVSDPCARMGSASERRAPPVRHHCQYCAYGF